MPIKGNKAQVVEEVEEVETVDTVETPEETLAPVTSENSETPKKKRGAPKGVARVAYPWSQEMYDAMKREAQVQAQVNGGHVNLSELHRKLITLPEFTAVPLELKEITLRNFYTARREDLKTKQLPEGQPSRTAEQVNAILPPPSGGGPRAKLSLV